MTLKPAIIAWAIALGFVVMLLIACNYGIEIKIADTGQYIELVNTPTYQIGISDKAIYLFIDADFFYNKWRVKYGADSSDSYNNLFPLCKTVL